MKYVPAILLVFVLSACKPNIKPESLYGTWKYIKVENPNETPPDSVGHEALQEASPSVRITPKDSLIITWGGQILSKGIFTISHQNIVYTEDITATGKRTFPFYVSKIDDKNLVFETLGEHGTRVTAVKEK